MIAPAYTMPGVLPFVFATLAAGHLIAPLRAFSRGQSALARPWSGFTLAAIVALGSGARRVRRLG